MFQYGMVRNGNVQGNGDAIFDCVEKSSAREKHILNGDLDKAGPKSRSVFLRNLLRSRLISVPERKGGLEYGNPEHHALKQMMGCNILTGGRKEGNADGDAVWMR
jgi:hypothetical protein